MKHNTLVFIYHGSSGIAGGYTAKFIDAIARDAKVHAFVNCQYIYQHHHPNIKTHRIFFPITDRLRMKQLFLRRAIRSIELMCAYAIILLHLLIIRTKWIIYNPITDLMATQVFTSLAKRLSGNFAVVVHDAQSHYGRIEKYRDRVFMNADLLVFHNEHSEYLLNHRLSLRGISHITPFPWSLDRLPSHPQNFSESLLFIGHPRPSKGLYFLLDAFEMYSKKDGRLTLSIAGLIPKDQYEKISRVASRIVNRHLEDQEFLEEIVRSKFLVMPYRPEYSNSSVHFCSIIHCGTPFICSDIELFKTFEDRVDCLKFEYGNFQSFHSALITAQHLDSYSRSVMATNALNRMKKDMQDFENLICDVFH
jgi:glycosyltransferase involved in cell wall biosynthesis